jgi:hypothetical protein
MAQYPIESGDELFGGVRELPRTGAVVGLDAEF